jgi:pimeloyl-ACP methyl ester carboxylesterase
MPFATLNDVRLYYKEQGEGQPVLLLHNYFGTLEVWSAQRDAFSRYYRVIIADARGHGRTLHPGGRLRLTDLAHDAAQLIRFLDIAPTHLVGSSLGAQTALHLAREEPHLVRTLAVIGPPHLTEPTTQTYMERVVEKTFPTNDRQLELEHRDQGPGHARSVLLKNFALDREEKPEDQIKALELAGGITCPTLVVGGDDDPVFPIRRALELAERIPDSELFILPHGGHFPHRTMPAVFNEVVLDFLRRRSP